MKSRSWQVRKSVSRVTGGALDVGLTLGKPGRLFAHGRSHELLVAWLRMASRERVSVTEESEVLFRVAKALVECLPLREASMPGPIAIESTTWPLPKNPTTLC